MTFDTAMQTYFQGDRLYGDDFDVAELKAWYAEQEYGYYTLASNQEKTNRDHTYGYHALNSWHGFQFLKNRTFDTCLGLGAARGDELAPLAGKVKNFIIIEPAEQYWVKNIANTPAKYLKPAISGELALPTSSVDLVTSFGVLHHIANVSYVLREIGRVLAPDGLLLCREPIHSMGDWRKPRVGITRTERGIPPHLLRTFLDSAGLDVVAWRYCMFAPISKLEEYRFVRGVWTKPWLVRLDSIVSLMFSRNIRYHRTKVFEKIAPHCVFFVARRRSQVPQEAASEKVP